MKKKERSVRVMKVKEVRQEEGTLWEIFFGFGAKPHEASLVCPRLSFQEYFNLRGIYGSAHVLKDQHGTSGDPLVLF